MSNPRVTGRELIRALIDRAGYTRLRENDRGALLINNSNGKPRRAVIKENNKPIPGKVLEFIAGPTQTNLGLAGLQRLIDKSRRHSN